MTRTGGNAMVENKTGIIPVRVTPTQEQRFRAAADAAGLRVSVWLRGLADREADRVAKGRAREG
jgi:hypothetical protein